MKGSIYPVYTWYIPKLNLISDFQYILLTCCFAPKTIELKHNILFNTWNSWLTCHSYQRQKLAAFLVGMRGGRSRNSISLLLVLTDITGRHCSVRTVIERSVIYSSTLRGPGISAAASAGVKMLLV